jgi:NAD(P)H-flavin reductase
VFYTHELTLTETTEVSPNIFTFVFIPKKTLHWKAGQHAVFSFPGTPIEGRGWRAFSIASSPEENEIRIATIIKGEPSAFKKVLRALQPGEKITMHGPFGEMYIKPSMKHIVGIAGGIGITPFRALIKSIAAGKAQDTTLTLIYSAQGDYTFKEEFDALTSPHIHIIYTRTPEEVNTALTSLVSEYKNSASYFVSGSPGMIGTLRKTLQEKGVKDIVNDSFKGY